MHLAFRLCVEQRFEVRGMSTYMRPTIRHDVSPSGYDYGHELTLERFNDYGERASGLSVTELSIRDLQAIAKAVIDYLGAQSERP